MAGRRLGTIAGTLDDVAPVRLVERKLEEALILIEAVGRRSKPHGGEANGRRAGDVDLEYAAIRQEGLGGGSDVAKPRLPHWMAGRGAFGSAEYCGTKYSDTG